MTDNEKQDIKLSTRQKLNILKQWNLYIEKIAPVQKVMQQVIYIRLFWMSIGKGKRECKISYPDLTKLCNVKSTRTLSATTHELHRIKHIKILARGFRTPTRYRVFTPLEIVTPDKYDKNPKFKRNNK